MWASYSGAVIPVFVKTPRIFVAIGGSTPSNGRIPSLVFV
jgi:hypothetical protein